MAALSMLDRAESYRRAFPAWPASWPTVVLEQGREVLYATWVLGNDYRVKSGFYGAYPNGYLPRVWSLFPDVAISPSTVLHAFSGALPEGPYTRLDSQRPAEISASVYELGAGVTAGPFDLILSDPPYTAVDAEKYGTPMISRLKATRALARVARPGSFMAWLDTAWPMHQKAERVTVGRIAIWRCTNHRARFLTIFRRV